MARNSPNGNIGMSKASINLRSDRPNLTATVHPTARTAKRKTQGMSQRKISSPVK